MKKILYFLLMCIIALSSTYPKVLTTFPYMINPIELRMVWKEGTGEIFHSTFPYMINPIELRMVWKEGTGEIFHSKKKKGSTPGSIKIEFRI